MSINRALLAAMRLQRPTQNSRQFISTEVKRAVRKVKDKRPIITDQRLRNTALNNEAKESKLDWRILSAT